MFTWHTVEDSSTIMELRKGNICVGGVTFNGCKARAFFGNKYVYDGDDQGEAMHIVLDMAEEQEKTRRSIFEEVKRKTATANPGRCLYASLIGATLVQKLLPYEKVLIQAGSMSWPIVPKEFDDGVSPTHFSYMWEPTHIESLRAVIENRLPEMHVWLIIPSTKEIIDFTTYELPEQMKRMLNREWKTEDPPDFLWAPYDKIPEDVVYTPNREATEYALWCIQKTVLSGTFAEMMKG